VSRAGGRRACHAGGPGGDGHRGLGRRVATVAVRGELGPVTCSRVHDRLAWVLESRPRRLVLDLQRVPGRFTGQVIGLVGVSLTNVSPGRGVVNERVTSPKRAWPLRRLGWAGCRRSVGLPCQHALSGRRPSSPDAWSRDPRLSLSERALLTDGDSPTSRGTRYPPFGADALWARSCGRRRRMRMFWATVSWQFGPPARLWMGFLRLVQAAVSVRSPTGRPQLRAPG
jgi:hypothetical protein